MTAWKGCSNLIKGLLVRFIHDYRDAERLILEMYYQHVYEVAYYMLQDRNKAQEILLDTFKKAFKYMHKVQNGEKLGEWLATIATRDCMDYLRKNKLYKAADDTLSQDLADSHDYLSTIETMVEEKFFMNGLHKEIDKLTPDYKQMVILKYHHEMGHDEIAHALDLHEAIIKKRLDLTKLTLIMGTLEQSKLGERGPLAKDKKLNVDRMIQEALADNMKHCPYPPLSAAEAWEQLQNSIQMKNISLSSFVRNRRNLGISALLLVILAMGLMWSSPDADIPASSTDITHAVPEDDYDIISNAQKQVEQLELGEVMEISDFSILVPQALPEEFKMNQVKVVRSPHEKSKEVYLVYEGEKRSFVITERALGEESGFSTVINRSHTEVQEIQVNGQRAHLFLFKNGTAQLVWMTDSHYFSVEGKLTRDEIMMIAESM